MIHTFDTDVAKEYGVNCAIILQNLYYWVEKNRANERHFYDGRYWTYNSVKAFEELFPYLSGKQIRSALNKLVDEGIIVDGYYNDSAYDRTKWYAITEKGMCFFQKRQTDLPSEANGDPENGKCINIYNNNIDTTTDINTDINTNKKQIYMGNNKVPSSNDNESCTESTNKKPRKPRASKFIPPTIEEVESYCKEKGYSISPLVFVSYYGSKGWMVGKNKMVNWRLAVAGWNAREQNKKPSRSSFDREAWINS